MFFQIIANNRFRNTLIGSVKVERRVLEEPDLIKAAAVNYFRNRFKEDIVNTSTLVGSIRRKISGELSNMLEKQFEVEEICAAIKDCNFNFVKKAWMGGFQEHAMWCVGINA